MYFNFNLRPAINALTFAIHIVILANTEIIVIQGSFLFYMRKMYMFCVMYNAIVRHIILYRSSNLYYYSSKRTNEKLSIVECY